MRKFVVICVVAVLFVAGYAKATTYFNDGAYHKIDYSISDGVYVDQGAPNAGTQVELVDGGGFSVGHGYDSVAFGNSYLTISGGQTGWSVDSADNSHVTIQGGYIGADLNVHSPYTQMKGGSVRTGVVMSGGCLYFSGGTFRDHLEAYSNGQIVMTGGTITKNLWAMQYAQARVSGGTIGGDLWAGDWNSLQTYGVLLFDGSNFKVNGHQMNSGDSFRLYATQGFDNYNNPALTGNVTGTLANGDILNKTFYIWGQGDMQVIPEPCTLLLLGLGGLMLRKKNI